MTTAIVASPMQRRFLETLAGTTAPAWITRTVREMRAMRALCDRGLVEVSADGYAITDDGRAALEG